MTPEDGMKLLLKSRVVHVVSGNTGEIYKFLGGWGVQVWNMDRSYERENWWWGGVTVRIPRKVKRYPRPFRWPRLTKTLVCHCKIGRMVVEGPNQVRCNRCKNLVGDESFPRRIARATNMLQKMMRYMTATNKWVIVPNPTLKKPKRKVVKKRAKAKSKTKVGTKKAASVKATPESVPVNPQVLPPNSVPTPPPIPTDQPSGVNRVTGVDQGKPGGDKTVEVSAEKSEDGVITITDVKVTEAS